MNKTVKDALAKGKADRIELDKKAVEAARKRAEKIEAEAAAYQAGLQGEAERCLSYIPDRLAKAVAKRENCWSPPSRKWACNLELLPVLIMRY